MTFNMDTYTYYNIYTIYPIGPKHAIITGVVITVTEDVFAAAGLPIV